MVYRTAMTAPAFSLRREIDRLFDDAFGGNGPRGAAGWVPPVDVRESEGELALLFEIPGVTPEQIEVTTDNGVLTVRGEKREERKEGEEGQFHLVERSYGTFSRSFQLPKNLDESKIEATFENGVLMVRIPKAALPQPKRIQVSAAKGGMNRVEGDVQHSNQSSSQTSKKSSGEKNSSQNSGANANQEFARAASSR